MKTIKIHDMTLRASASLRESALTFKEKLEIARSLDRLKVDAIELAPIGAGKADQLANRTIAGTVSAALSAAIDVATGDVDAPWASVKGAKHPRLNLLVPVSPVQMEYTCHKKAPAMLEAIREQIARCRVHCESVEFTAVDATRAEPKFLYSAIEAAIGAGANKVTLCDTSGVMLPDEFAVFVANAITGVKGVENAAVYVQPSDEMGMALACAAAAIKAGATGVKCTAVPMGYPTLETVARFAQIKGADMDIAVGLRTTELNRAVAQMERMLGAEKAEPSVMDNVGLGDAANVTLDINDEIGEVIKVVRQLGYDLSDEDNAKVYEAFRRVASRKHFVGTKELDAIVASTALQVPSTYHIENYVINSGNVITATANILLDRNGEKIRGVGVGDGPIDAAFLAIEQIIGHHYELDDFQIQTVTEGRDAMGSALVKLRADGRVYSGNGISTDIIGASIRAYISALNKIVYEEA